MTDHLDRKLTAREKIAKALALHLDGRPWAEIAREVGYANEQNAHRAVRRHLAQHPADGIEEMRQTDNMRLERIIKELTEYAREVHYATCSRGLVYFDGKPVIDRSPNIAAYRALDKVIASHRRLNGLDAPVTIRLEDVAEDSEIETIVATMITASSVLCYPTGYAGPELDA